MLIAKLECCAYYFTVFMVDLPKEKLHRYADLVPLRCHLSRLDKVLHIQLRRPAKDFPVQILEADPFVFYELEAGKDFGFVLEYVGPKSVAYDSVADCVVPYSNAVSSFLFLPNSPNDCLVLDVKSVFKFWHKNCRALYYLDESRIQIKLLGDKYSIYCHGYNITAYRSTFPCPAHVFRLNVNESFLISVGVGRPLVRHDFSPNSELVSTKVNFHLMPHLLNLSMAEFPIISPCPTPSLNLKLVFGIIGGILGLLILGLSLVVLYLVRKSKDQENQGGVVTIVRELRLQLSPQIRVRPRVEKENRKSLANIPSNRVRENVKFFETVALEELEGL